MASQPVSQYKIRNLRNSNHYRTAGVSSTTFCSHIGTVPDMPPKSTSKSTKAPSKGKAAGKTSPKSKDPKDSKEAKKSQGGAAAKEKAPAAPPPQKTIGVKQLASVVLEDSTGDIKASGLYPLIIDETNVANTFLRYRDVNYLNAQNPGDMDRVRIRMALLGALRFGKPMVLDLADTDMVNVVIEKFDTVKEGLLDMIISKEITKEENYKPLVLEDSDEPAYSSWFEYKQDEFNFIILAANETACAPLKNRFYNFIIG